MRCVVACGSILAVNIVATPHGVWRHSWLKIGSLQLSIVIPNGICLRSAFNQVISEPSVFGSQSGIKGRVSRAAYATASPINGVERDSWTSAMIGTEFHRPLTLVKVCLFRVRTYTTGANQNRWCNSHHHHHQCNGTNTRNPSEIRAGQRLQGASNKCCQSSCNEYLSVVAVFISFGVYCNVNVMLITIIITIIVVIIIMIIVVISFFIVALASSPSLSLSSSSSSSSFRFYWFG